MREMHAAHHCRLKKKTKEKEKKGRCRKASAAVSISIFSNVLLLFGLVALLKCQATQPATLKSESERESRDVLSAIRVREKQGGGLLPIESIYFEPPPPGPSTNAVKVHPSGPRYEGRPAPADRWMAVCGFWT